MKSYKVFRPTLDDVERLSLGKGARRRGTGSKYVCHRLNRDERVLYEIAKECGFLTVQGSSYRKERKGSPVRNIFRQRCDALEELCIIIEKRSPQDRICIDFSTLRVKNDRAFIDITLQQVIKAKYPDLYASTQVLCEKQTIDWNNVKTNPIWKNDERLVVVECDRHIAKSMALDILKLSSKFDTAVYDNKVKENAQNAIELNKSIMQGVCSPDSTAPDENNADCIDWSDI